MTKTETYKNWEKEYNNRWISILNIFMASWIIFGIGVFAISMLTIIGGVPITQSVVSAIIISIVMSITAAPVATFLLVLSDSFTDPKRRFDTKIEGTVKDKVACHGSSTIYLDTDEIVYSNDRAYFDLAVGEKYAMVIDKRNVLGKYKVIEPVPTE